MMEDEGGFGTWKLETLDLGVTAKRGSVQGARSEECPEPQGPLDAWGEAKKG